MASLLNSFFLGGVESLLNGMISLDPATRDGLSRLEGKSLRIHSRHPEACITVTIVDQSVWLSQDNTGETDTRISGEAATLLKLLFTRDQKLFHRDDLDVSGDTGLLAGLQGLMSGLDPDWEYQLSKFIGDIPVQTLSSGMSHAGNFARHVHTSLVQDIDEYIHEEKRLFPLREACEEFYAGVDALRLRLDRLQARVDHLHKSVAAG